MTNTPQPCGHHGLNWNGEGDCIACARDKVLELQPPAKGEDELRETLARLFDAGTRIKIHAGGTMEAEFHYKQFCVDDAMQAVNEEADESLEKIDGAMTTPQAIIDPMSDITKVTRFEVIDHTTGGEGRVFTKYGVSIELSYQDDGQTLKVFVRDRGDE
ncbi:hypothetical protein RCF27_09280 [Rhodococcus pyridinivorans]|nr:hypothetical protein [Rhodococcus pyridinivorans]WMM74450.1 hypothetical protein RCF27_09280 [Rhodococcus pyridinivorans]